MTLPNVYNNRIKLKADKYNKPSNAKCEIYIFYIKHWYNILYCYNN